MAAISTSTYGSGQTIARAGTGLVNLRASHTFMVRVKHSSTATNYDSVIASYIQTTGTFGNGGTWFGRNNGLASSALNFYRISDTGTLSGLQAPTGAYGNTTTWYHLAVVYNASTQTIRTYFDGVFKTQTSSTTTAVPNSTSNTFGIAAHPGKYADFAIFNRALSDAEVADMADYRVPQVTSGLVAFWRLDSDATDSSGNGNNGTVSGSAPNITWSTADNPPQPEEPTVDIAGNAASSSALTGALTNLRLLAGNAASSSALSSTITVQKPIAGAAASSSAFAGQLQARIAGAANSSSAFGAWLRPRWGRRSGASATGVSLATSIPTANNFTLMGWVRSFGTTSAAGARIRLTGSDVLVGLGVRTSGGTPQRWINLNDATFANVVNYTATDDLGWHHLAITYDGTNARAYVDGSLVATSGAVSMSGTFDTLYTLTGDTDDIAEVAHVKLWTAALSDTEVAAEYDYATPHNHLAQLYGWWQLAWNNVTLDSSGNGRTLTDNSSAEAQTESPGALLQLLGGDAASSSAFAGSLTTLKPIFGSATSQSVFQGTITVSLPHAGDLASSSALTAQLTALVSGDAASASSFAASLTTLKPIAGDAASSSAFAAALTALLTGSLGSASALSGTLSQSVGFAGSLGSSSALAAALGIQGAFAGNLASASALAAEMLVAKPVAGDLASSSALTAAMVQDYAIASALASDSALTGTLNVQLDIAGTLTSTSAFGGTLTVPLEIQGALASVSALGGTLGTAVSVSGVLASGSAFAAQLTAEIAGNAASSSALTGLLGLATPIAGNAASVSTFAGAISVVALRPLVGVSAQSESRLLGSLTVTVPAAASGEVVTDGSAYAAYGPAVIPPTRIPRRWPPRY